LVSHGKVLSFPYYMVFDPAKSSQPKVSSFRGSLQCLGIFCILTVLLAPLGIVVL
jgi:hypothetical protein